MPRKANATKPCLDEDSLRLIRVLKDLQECKSLYMETKYEAMNAVIEVYKLGRK